MFTKDPEPHLKSKARFMHCLQDVIYEKKSAFEGPSLQMPSIFTNSNEFGDGAAASMVI
jgi:hypothetical protein